MFGRRDHYPREAHQKRNTVAPPELPHRKRNMPKPKLAHRIRIICPAVDYDHDRPNKCQSRNCRNRGEYVETWRLGQRLNAAHRARLLCRFHAQKLTEKHHKKLPTLATPSIPL